jgi:hypothetical protein
MATRMQQRRGTAQQWTTANPILAAGEIGFESGTNKFKIGDGVNTWSSLTYYASASEIAALVDGAPELLNTLNELAAAIGDDANFGTAIEMSINTSVDESNTFTTTAINTHNLDTTNVHGIVDTSLLATTANISTHNSDTTDVHGIADTSLLVTQTVLDGHTGDTTGVHGIADTSLLATKQYSDNAVDTHSADTTSVHGIQDTSLLVTTTMLDTHNTDTTNVHGIADTALLATQSYASGLVSTHNDDTTNVHGIVDTALLATKAYADDAADAAETAAITAAGLAADTKISTQNAITTNVHGIADTSLLATTADVAAVTKTSLGLGNVDNTADASKPVSTAQSTAIATAKAEAIADATSQVNALLTGAPAALNTLDELAAALGDDANFAASVTTNLGLKVDSLTPISQKTASYTLSSLTERDDLIEMGSASAMTLTIPTDATLDFPIGTSIDILQTGAGQVTIAPVSGTVTVNATPGLKLRTTWSSCTLFKRAANTWVVYGDLTA